MGYTLHHIEIIRCVPVPVHVAYRGLRFCARQHNWTQNVVILEAELTVQERVWYIRAIRQFGWSKLELQRKILAKAHLEMVLDTDDKVCYTKENGVSMGGTENDKCLFYLPWEYTSCP